MGKRDLTKHLKHLGRAELEEEIKKLYSKFPMVKKYYDFTLGADTGFVLDDFKEKIKREYFPKRGYGKARNSVSRKVVSDFKKISDSQKGIIELLLYRVEMMIGFTAAYGDIDEAFYYSLETSFAEACKRIADSNLSHLYRERCLDLIDSTEDFGWGVHDSMEESYEDSLGGIL